MLMANRRRSSICRVDLTIMRENESGKNFMADEQVQRWIAEYRAVAQQWGTAALEAMRSGDAGRARTATRQAAKYARIAMQLENGEKQFVTEDA
jgi:hypothetical protein